MGIPEKGTEERSGQSMGAIASFSCVLNSAKTIHTLLACLRRTSQGGVPGRGGPIALSKRMEEHVICEVDRSQGLIFSTSSVSKTVTLQTLLPLDVLESLELNDKDATTRGEDADGDLIRFKVSLVSLLDALTVFGNSSLTSTSVSISYFPEDSKVVLVLEEHGIVTECEIGTLVLDDDTDCLVMDTYLGNHSSADGQSRNFWASTFERSPIVAKTIMKSEALHDAFTELAGLPSAASVDIRMRQPRPDLLASQEASINRQNDANICFQLIAQGEASVCTIDFRRSSAAFVSFECDAIDVTDDSNSQEYQGVSMGNSNYGQALQGGFKARYHLAVLDRSFRALPVAEETYLRMNKDGILSIQHMLVVQNGQEKHRCFIDAIVCPEESDTP